MRRIGVLLAAGVLIGAVVFVGLPILMFLAVTSEDPGSGSCDRGPSGSAVLPATATTGTLTEPQLDRAAPIVSVGYDLRVPRQAMVVALAVASQESGFRNYANNGLGEDLIPVQDGIDASMALPHDAVGSDHGSL